MRLKRKTYQTRRLVLRPYLASDYAVWEWAYKNILPKQAKYDWIPPSDLPTNRTQFQTIVRRHNLLEREGSTYIWSIFDRKTGALLGHVDVHVIARDVLQFANLGYRIINRYWRKGYATEALTHIIPAVFKDLQLNRLEAVIDPDNKASIALARSIEMRREGIRRKYYYQDGGWADQVVFVAVREDYGIPPLNPERRK